MALFCEQQLPLEGLFFYFHDYRRKMEEGYLDEIDRISFFIEPAGMC